MSENCHLRCRRLDRRLAVVLSLLRVYEVRPEFGLHPFGYATCNQPWTDATIRVARTEMTAVAGTLTIQRQIEGKHHASTI